MNNTERRSFYREPELEITTIDSLMGNRLKLFDSPFPEKKLIGNKLEMKNVCPNHS